MLSSCSPKLYRGSVICDVELVSEHPTDRQESISLDIPSNAIKSKYPQYYKISYLTIQIFNKTEERLFVEWDHSRFISHYSNSSNFKVRYLKNDLEPKSEEAISAKSYSLKRKILHLSEVDNSISVFCNIYELIQGTTKEYLLKIPIRFPDGSVEEYIYRLKFYWQNSM